MGSSTTAPASDAKSTSLAEPKKNDEVKAHASGIKSFLSGGFGGIACVLVGHPFDLTKVRLQAGAPGEYSGAVDVVRKTFARDGLKGFFKGMGSPLVGVTPMFAVSFWGYAQGKNLVYSFTKDRQSPELTLSEFAFAGAFSALPTTLVATPVERIKVVLQTDSAGKYKGPLHAIAELYKEGGLRSIYRGTLATVARDAPGSAAYFVAYEWIKAKMTPKDASQSDLNLVSILTAGGFAGMAMWSLAIPPDTVKSRLQSAPHGTYTGFIDCAKQLIAKDGVSALFRGFGPAMARAFPANAATFLGVEASLKMMNYAF